MHDEREPQAAPAGARCAIHPERNATGTCPRCGNFSCAACVENASTGRLQCVACAAQRPELATHWARFFAALIDNLLFGVPLTLLMVGAVQLPLLHDLNTGILLLGGVGFALVTAGTLFMMQRHGQSIGKRLWHIRVLRKSYEPASLTRIAFLRAALPAVLGSIPLVGGLVSLIDALFIFRDDRRCLHDLIADTIVVEGNPSDRV